MKAALASLSDERSGSWIHGLDPRARIIAACLWSLGVVSIAGVPWLLVALGLSVALLLSARLPLAATLKRMAMMDGFIVFMLIMLPFTVPGEPLFTVFGFPASLDGVIHAAQIALKANAVVLALMVLVGTMEPSTLGHALSRLKVPASLVHLMLFTVRYIEVIHQEYARLRVAMKTRGFRPSNSLHTYRTFGYLIGMLLVRALERSERILQAMKCRGFNGTLPLLDTLAYRRRDGVFVIVCVITLGLLLAADRLPEVFYVGIL